MARTVADAAVLLTVLANTEGNPLAGHDFTADLDSQALVGARIGIVASQIPPEGDENRRLWDAAIAALQAQGATLVLVDVDTAIPKSEMWLSGSTSGLWEFHRDMNRYLGRLPANAPMKSLSDIDDYYKTHADARKYGRMVLPLAVAKDLDPNSADTAAAQAEIAAIRADARGKIDPPMAEHNLTALLFVGSGGAGTGARAEYPSLTVPAGYRGSDGQPFNITFLGRSWSEPTLIGYGYAYERATQLRRPPSQVSSTAHELRFQFEQLVTQRMAVVRDPEAAADLVTEVFRRAVARVAELAAAQDADVWILTLAEEVLFERNTRIRRAIEVAARGPEERGALIQASDEDFHRAVATLPDDQRQALLLLFSSAGTSTTKAPRIHGVDAGSVPAGAHEAPTTLFPSAAAIPQVRGLDAPTATKLVRKALQQLVIELGTDLGTEVAKLSDLSVVDPVAVVTIRRAGLKRPDLLRDLVNRLRRLQWECFLRWWVRGQSVKAITIDLKSNERAIQELLSATLDTLARWLSGEEQPPEGAIEKPALEARPYEPTSLLVGECATYSTYQTQLELWKANGEVGDPPVRPASGDWLRGDTLAAMGTALRADLHPDYIQVRTVLELVDRVADAEDDLIEQAAVLQGDGTGHAFTLLRTADRGLVVHHMDHGREETIEGDDEVRAWAEKLGNRRVVWFEHANGRATHPLAGRAPQNIPDDLADVEIFGAPAIDRPAAPSLAVAIWNRHGHSVVQEIFTEVGSLELAKRLADEVFQRAQPGFGRISLRDLERWLARHLRDVMADHIDRKRQRSRITRAAESHSLSVAGVNWSRLEAALEQLDDEHQEIVELRYGALRLSAAAVARRMPELDGEAGVRDAERVALTRLMALLRERTTVSRLSVVQTALANDRNAWSAALARLSPRRRQCLRLWLLEGCSTPDIAELTDDTESNVKSLKQNAVRDMAVALTGGKLPILGQRAELVEMVLVEHYRRWHTRIGLLSPQQQRCLQLRFQAGLNNAEIARRIPELTERQVADRSSQAITRMTELIFGDEPRKLDCAALVFAAWDVDKAALLDCLRQLPENHAECVTQRHLQGLSAEQVAKQLDCSIRQVTRYEREAALHLIRLLPEAFGPSYPRLGDARQSTALEVARVSDARLVDVFRVLVAGVDVHPDIARQVRDTAAYLGYRPPLHQLRPSKRRFTVEDVAVRANVSVRTVHRYMHNPESVGERTRKRLRTTMVALDFTPAPVAALPHNSQRPDEPPSRRHHCNRWRAQPE